jgi:hypothetical protein
MNRAGQRGTVVRGEQDALHYRLMIDEGAQLSGVNRMPCTIG